MNFGREIIPTSSTTIGVSKFKGFNDFDICSHSDNHHSLPISLNSAAHQHLHNLHLSLSLQAPAISLHESILMITDFVSKK